jgi:hypothetical protein
MLIIVDAANVVDVHDAWATWALQSKPNHSAIQPFEGLDSATQAKDEPYVAALRRVARSYSPK